MKRRSVSTYLPVLLLAAIAVFEPTANAARAAPKPPKTTAKQVVVMSWPLGIVLFAKKADSPMSPSSMTKLMSMLLVIEAIKAGRTRTDRIVTITQAATRTRGSRLRLKRGAKITVADLLRAMVIGSANDAAKALAIHIAGSEKKFARQMTARAKALGLKGSSFRNATGFSAKGHRMTARDVAVLTAHLLYKHPKYFALFAQPSFKFKKRTLKNRNPVLGRVEGADGVKTGQTRAGGYGLAASAVRGKVRLILVINGLKSAAARRREAIALLEWGFKTVAP